MVKGGWVHGRSRLVPQTTPSSALICAYASSNTAKQPAGWALSGRRSLTGGLVELAVQLTWQPRSLPGQQIPCIDMAEPQTNYLIGLSYPGGATIWVAATDDPNVCATTSNGDFTSSGDVGPDASKAFASGRWPAPRPLSHQVLPGPRPARPGHGDGSRGLDARTICAPKAHTLTSGYGPSY